MLQRRSALLVSTIVIASLHCASRQPAPEPAPVVPAAAGSAVLSLDVRGAFGPTRQAHVDVFPDGRVTCLHRPAQGPDQTGALALDAAEVQGLLDLAERVGLPQAHAVPRRALIMDLGTTTLSGRIKDQAVSVAVDGRYTVEPSPGALVEALEQLEHRCLAGTDGGAP